MPTAIKTCRCNTHTPGCPTGWDIYREWEAMYWKLKRAIKKRNKRNNGDEIKSLNEQMDRKEDEYMAHVKSQGAGGRNDSRV